MNINKQNIAIAELCGVMRSYASDLNAMHAAEKVYSDDDAWTEKYWMALYQASVRTRWPYDATSAQRAEAFLRVHGKWEDAK